MNDNPLHRLPHSQKEKLFGLLRSGIGYDAVDRQLFNDELPIVTEDQANQFFRTYASEYWNRKLDRAAQG